MMNSTWKTRRTRTCDVGIMARKGGGIYDAGTNSGHPALLRGGKGGGELSKNAFGTFRRIVLHFPGTVFRRN